MREIKKCGIKLRILREKKDLSRGDVAAVVGCTSQVIRKIENEKIVAAPFYIYLNLANFFNISLDWLFSDLIIKKIDVHKRLKIETLKYFGQVGGIRYWHSAIIQSVEDINSSGFFDFLDERLKTGDVIFINCLKGWNLDVSCVKVSNTKNGIVSVEKVK